ncbi:hypothetical protein BDW62DRAFT_206818 [Aspergillus aurantiobrunneus]
MHSSDGITETATVSAYEKWQVKAPSPSGDTLSFVVFLSKFGYLSSRWQDESTTEDEDTKSSECGRWNQNISDRGFRRRVNFFAVIGDYAGRLFNCVQYTAGENKIEGLPDRPGKLKDALEEERRFLDEDIGDGDSGIEFEELSPSQADQQEPTEHRTYEELVRDCLRILNKEPTIRAVGLNAAVVEFAAELYHQRNELFHGSIGCPDYKNDKKELEKFRAQNKASFPQIFGGPRGRS